MKGAELKVLRPLLCLRGPMAGVGLKQFATNARRHLDVVQSLSGLMGHPPSA